MTGPLALSGDRPFTQGCTHDIALVDLSGADEVVVVPTAAAYEGPEVLVESAATWFHDLGVACRSVDLYTRDDAHDVGIVDELAAARFLYLVGGSPMHLRSVLRDTPAWDVIRSRHADGVLVAASGGAAMTLSDPMVDPRGGAFTLGLGLIDCVAVVAQSGWSADQARRTVRMAPPTIPVLGIDPTAAVVRRSDGVWEAGGTGEVVVYLAGAEAPLDVLP